jgi:subtilisin family serine protease
MKKDLHNFFNLFLTLTVIFFSAVPSFASNYESELLLSRFSSWGTDPDKHLASINLKKSWTQFKKNKDIIVAVIDTGIQPDHPYLAKNIYVPGKKTSQALYGVDFSGEKPTYTPKDLHGHGTHIAGIIKSVFPEVKLFPLKYLNPKATGADNVIATIKALRFAVNSNVDIINYSGGGPQPSDEELKILRHARQKGILVIAAAGNEHANIDDDSNGFYPASYRLDNIISVGAHDVNLNIIPSSNYGKNTVDIAAPGDRIRSAIPSNGAGYMTGTSQATAFVTGVAAMIKAKYPYLKFNQIKNFILTSSLKVKNFEGKVRGAAKLDAARAIELADAYHQKLKLPTSRTVANQK